MRWSLPMFYRVVQYTLANNMKITVIITALILGVATLGKADEEKLPLMVDAPQEWSVDFKGDKGIQFFAIKRTEGEAGLLMFSLWPVPGNKDQIPQLVKSLAKTFLEQAKANPKITLENDGYKSEKIEGVEFSGEYVSFAISNGMLQTMFMISNGDGIWSGQFTGSMQGWSEALEILKKLKKS
jgi:hypothetical protein